jgi:hypothetical protein
MKPSQLYCPPIKKSIKNLRKKGLVFLENNMGNTIIFSDLHANFFAAQYIKKAMLEADDVWALGDFFGRGPHAKETALFIENYLNKYDHWVLGNHEAYIWNLVGKDIKAKYQKPTAKTLDHHTKVLNRFNGSLKSSFVKDRASLRWVDDKFALVHSTPGDPMGIGPSVIRPYDTKTWLMKKLVRPFLKIAKKKLGKGKKIPNVLLFCGHSHVPMFINYSEERGFTNYEAKIRYGEMIDIPNGITIVNPGSIGLPRVGSNTFIELDREKRQLALHAFRLSRRCKTEIRADMKRAGRHYENKIRMSFRIPPDEETIEAKKTEYYEMLQERENVDIPETGEDLCFN